MECSLPQRSKGTIQGRLALSRAVPAGAFLLIFIWAFGWSVYGRSKGRFKAHRIRGCCELFNSRFVFESLVRIVSCSENAPQPRREAFPPLARPQPIGDNRCCHENTFRREFLIAASAATVAIAAAPAFAAGPSAKGRQRVFIGSGTPDGILAFDWDSVTGELMPAGSPQRLLLSIGLLFRRGGSFFMLLRG